MTEQEHVAALIKRLLAEGYGISVDNGGDDFEVSDARTWEEIQPHLFATDEDQLYVNKGSYRGVIRCIYGNSAEEVIADYSASLAPICDQVYKELFIDATPD